MTAILEDHTGMFWLATPGELMRFSPREKRYTYYRNDPLDPHSLSYNIVLSLYEDRSNVLWVGTAGQGLNIFDPKARRFQTLRRKQDPASRVAGFSVRSILEDTGGDVWISTDVLYQWQRASGRLRSFETSSNRPDDFGNTGAYSMVQDRQGTVWLATAQGLFRRDASSGRVRQYKFDPANPSGLREKVVWGVFVDRAGLVWVATEHFFSKLIDAANGRFQHFRYRQELSETEPAFTAIHQTGDGRFWLGTRGGLLSFESFTGVFRTYRNDPADSHSLSNDIIKSICADPRETEHVLWIGTAGGLNRFDLADEQFRHYTESDGLPNNVVYGVLAQGDSALWLSTNKGLSRFDLQTEQFKNYDVSDGLQSNEFNTGAFFKSRSGELFFGGIKGLNYFDPGAVKDNPHPPALVITDLKILIHSVSPRDSQSVLAKTITETEAITLSHRDNVVSFEFAGLDYSAPEKNRYAYKLEGFNEDWIQSGTVRSATFTNLPAGDYVFRVKGSNNDGIWNEQGVSLKFTVAPPWWKTWWAYSIYGLALLAALFGVRRYELNRIQLKNRLQIEQVAAEKLREVDHLKSRFFANISHEFRTPLTLILGQLESVQALPLAREDRGRLQIAFRNAHRLLRLINELLDLSRLDAGSMQLAGETQNLISFLKNLVSSFELPAQQRDIGLSFGCDREYVPVWFEPDKLEKVFVNLLSNAMKFTPDGGSIAVAVAVASAANHAAENGAPTARIRITDTGAGIPAEHLPHIFDRYYQANGSFRRSGKEHAGSGLGLALAKELVELHRGSISVASRQGVGTEFVVALPLAAEGSEQLSVSTGQSSVSGQKVGEELRARDERSGAKGERRDEKADQVEAGCEDEDVGLRQASSGDEPAADSEKPRGADREIVLLVEDHAEVRAYVREQLADKYDVVEAGSGDDGLARATELIPDVIITDVMMPSMNGYQLSKQIRQDEKTSHIPIIMLTARAALEDKIEGLETGVDAYLVKPFSSRELLVRVQNLIQQRRELRRRFRQATVIKPSEVAATSVDQVFLENAIAAIEAHFADERFDVEALAEAVHMSVPQLNRKLRALLDQPAGQLIRSLRLQRAADLLKQNAGSVAEICYEVGFSDQANFTRAFKRQFGVAPGGFRKRG